MSTIRDEVRNGKILVVDDNKSNLLLLESILDIAGFHYITSTNNPCEVAELHRKYDFDLILLDYRMPDMNGLDVLKNLPHYRNYLPVIMLTGQSDLSTRLAALAAGAKDFLAKPFDPNEVLRRAENVMATCLLLKERDSQAAALERAVHQRTLELEQSRLEMIRALARAGEYRDNETGRHIQRMSRYCGLLAIAAGLEKKHAELLEQASPMHDLGKIGIPDAILLKPDRLTPEEYRFMQKHAEIGAEIIAESEIPLLVMARTVALTHHERYDGTGYPYGLAGEQIPIEGRIVAVCDVFDALTSTRPYKKAWAINEAMDFLLSNAGKHFDPQLVKVFQEILPEISRIKKQLSDSES